ncbi:hypothetical protein LguiB_012483 [Lonicera macranthoides]
MLYIIRVYIVENRKNHLTSIFQTLYHMCELKHAPFLGSVVFGKNRDGDF